MENNLQFGPFHFPLCPIHFITAPFMLQEMQHAMHCVWHLPRLKYILSRITPPHSFPNTYFICLNARTSSTAWRTLGTYCARRDLSISKFIGFPRNEFYFLWSSRLTTLLRQQFVPTDFSKLWSFTLTLSFHSSDGQVRQLHHTIF